MTDAEIKSTARTLADLSQLSLRINAETADANAAATHAASQAAPPRRKRAKKITRELGPFETAVKFFERGDRVIEISRITPTAIYFRLRGFSDERCLPFGAAYQRATAAVAGFDTGPRTGAIKRGS